MMKYIVLESKEGEFIKVKRSVIKCADTVMYVAKYYDFGDPVPLFCIRTEILRKIISWAEHHKHDKVPTGMNNDIKSINISAWDADFLDVDRETLSEITMSAWCMGIKDLQRTCFAVAKKKGSGKRLSGRTKGLINALFKSISKNIKKINDKF